jgi:hypothetical protein
VLGVWSPHSKLLCGLKREGAPHEEGPITQIKGELLSLKGRGHISSMRGTN